MLEVRMKTFVSERLKHRISRLAHRSSDEIIFHELQDLITPKKERLTRIFI